MKARLATRVAALETARAAALAAWWDGLTEPEQQATIDTRFGQGTWAWLSEYVVDYTETDLATPGYVWQAYHRWRTDRP